MQSSEHNPAGAETQDIPSGMTSLAELLSEGESKPEPEQEAAGADDQASGSEQKPELTKFNDLAEKLGVDLDALYKLQVSSSEDGEPVTIEELKDLHKSKADFELEQIDWKERQLTQEQDLTRAKAELQEILAMLPEKAVKPEALEKIRAKHEAQVKLERKKTLDAIPEWKDAKVRTADIEGMSEHLQGYGFPVNYLENIVNHKQLKYIRDNWQREQRVRKALEQVRAGKPNKSPAARTQDKAPVKNPVGAVKRGSARNTLEAVFSQLD